MKCDIEPEHGEMNIEPMYGTNGEVLQYGYFCQFPECDGYGGPVKQERKSTSRMESQQMSLFEEVKDAA